jgi:release factor glutamine methyltransferase
MRPAEIVRRGADYLDRHDVESPRASSEALMMHVLGTDRAGVYGRSDGLTTGEAKAFGRALCRRCSGTPLQHLTGEQGFRRLLLTVRPGVFIPRPETEVLVDTAFELASDVAAPLVADIGTGTGAVALAIRDELPNATVWAVDLSEDAVALARENAERLGLEVHVIPGDLLAALPQRLRGRLDLVVANPPYVRDEALGSLPVEVSADPLDALTGPPDLYARLIEQAAGWLRSGGGIALEIGDDMGAEIVGILDGSGFERTQVHRDGNDRDRVVTARRP